MKGCSLAKRESFVCVHDRTGRLIAVSQAFARHFAVDPQVWIGRLPPFPWWPADWRAALQSGFELALSEAGRQFEGMKILMDLQTVGGDAKPYLLHFEALPDGTTAIYTEAHHPEMYDELAVRVVELGRFARSLVSKDASPKVTTGLLSLSPREKTVVEMLMSGERIDQIARALHVSIHTLRNHRRSIYRKLDVRSHVELITVLDGRGGP